MRARAACSDGLRTSDGVERHMVRSGFGHAQPDAVTDWGSYAVADWGSDAVTDRGSYAVAHSEPNTHAYARPHAGPDPWPHTEVRQCQGGGLLAFESCDGTGCRRGMARECFATS